jgi:transcriptional regulator of acetoin/glycerol metabolism
VKLSISAAARRAGVERTTLYRRIEKGEISKETGDDGKPVIDLSELARLYPQALEDKADTDVSDSANSSVQQFVTPPDGAALQREVELLRERIASLEADKADLRSERDRLLGVMERHAEAQGRLLAAPKPGLLARLLGRAGTAQ